MRFSEDIVNLKALVPSVSSSLIGATGFLSALVTMFVNIQETVSIKWFIFLIWLFLTLSILMIKRIIELEVQNKELLPLPFEKPLKILEDKGIILIRKNKTFANNIIVGCYFINDDVEKIAFSAHVYHTQDNFVQLKILKNYCSEDERQLLSVKGITSSIIVRPNIPYELFLELGENNNDK